MNNVHYSYEIYQTNAPSSYFFTTDKYIIIFQVCYSTNDSYLLKLKKNSIFATFHRSGLVLY